jgi:hypothetical protein
MDITLQNILINTYNNDQSLRSLAEKALNDFLRTPNFLATFFIVIDGYRNNEGVPTLHHDIRMAAAIVVKNNLRSIWIDILSGKLMLILETVCMKAQVLYWFDEYLMSLLCYRGQESSTKP